jgi:hypothetical protein
VAVGSDSRKLVLFDFQTQKSTDCQTTDLGFPAWSRDSKYLYFDSTFSIDQSSVGSKLETPSPKKPSA